MKSVRLSSKLIQPYRYVDQGTYFGYESRKVKSVVEAKASEPYFSNEIKLYAVAVHTYVVDAAVQ